MILLNSGVLEDIFGYTEFKFSNVRHVSYSIHDNEAINESSSFVDTKWVDVTPIIFQNNFEAFSFFSSFSFYIFTPSLIRSSFQSYSMTHLSIQVFLNTLLEHRDSQALNTINEERWLQFSISQLNAIKLWVEFFDGYLLSFLTIDRKERYLNRLEYYIAQAEEYDYFITCKSTFPMKGGSPRGLTSD